MSDEKDPWAVKPEDKYRVAPRAEVSGGLSNNAEISSGQGKSKHKKRKRVKRPKGDNPSSNVLSQPVLSSDFQTMETSLLEVNTSNKKYSPKTKKEVYGEDEVTSNKITAAYDEWKSNVSQKASKAAKLPPNEALPEPMQVNKLAVQEDGKKAKKLKNFNSSNLATKFTFAQPYVNESGVPIGLQATEKKELVDNKVIITPFKYDLLDVMSYDNDGVKDGVGKPNNSPTRMAYTPWAHNMGVLTSILFIFFGITSVLWDFRLDTAKELPPGTEKLMFQLDFVGFYTIGAGVFLFLFEFFYGLNKTAASYSEASCNFFGYMRSLMYLILSIPTFASYATIWSGLIGVFTAFANLLAARNKERGQIKLSSHERRWMYWVAYFDWESDRGTYYIAMFFIFLNVLFFTSKFVKFEFLRLQCANLFPGDQVSIEANCPSVFAPYAKGFGNLLNLDCSFILFPVMRNLLTGLLERRYGNDQKKAAFFPARKAIEFHKVIASVIFLSTIGHVASHYANYTISADITIKAFGFYAWYTGAAICAVMALLFPGAHYLVKRTNYELFWNTHHTYTIFFLLLVAHGPQFWLWFLIPVLLFAAEKVSRHRSRKMRSVYVRSVEFIPPVININFTPENPNEFSFREGQYLYIMCPIVSDSQWHPFSMSSAYADLEKFGYVSLHIRVNSDDKLSWTYQLKELFRNISGAGHMPPETPFRYSGFHHYDTSGKRIPGLLNGPDAQPLIRIDGCYNSPTQVYGSYKDVILVGSGIGLTPSAAILRSILRYKWSKGFFPDGITFCWLLRRSEVRSFRWFLELLADLMNKVKQDRLAGATSDAHFLQINIYVTGDKEKPAANTLRNKIMSVAGLFGVTSVRAPEGMSPMTFFNKFRPQTMAFMRPNNTNSNSDAANLPKRGKKNRKKQQEKIPVPVVEKPKRMEDMLEVTEAGFQHTGDLEPMSFEALVEKIALCRIDSSEQKNTSLWDPAPNRVEDIWIWRGRPDWDAVFSQTKKMALGRKGMNELEKGGNNYSRNKSERTDIGVCFCGGAAIGKDLSQATRTHTTKNCHFTLNQEYF